MIASAMMFALGACVASLVALAFGIVWTHRVERVTARRLLSRVSATRGEIAVERVEERARAAVAAVRLERQMEIAREIAASERAASSRKAKELADLHAEHEEKLAELRSLESRLAAAVAAQEETERQLADTNAALRAAHGALESEIKRRAAMQEALEGTSGLADRRSGELEELHAENEALRAQIRELRRGLPETTREAAPVAEAALPPPPLVSPVAPAPAASRVITLPVRAPQPVPAVAVAPEERTPETEHVEEVADRLHRMVSRESGDGVHRLVARGSRKTAERRFKEALEEIRTLKQVGSPPAE